LFSTVDVSKVRTVTYHESVEAPPDQQSKSRFAPVKYDVVLCVRFSESNNSLSNTHEAWLVLPSLQGVKPEFAGLDDYDNPSREPDDNALSPAMAACALRGAELCEMSLATYLACVRSQVQRVQQLVHNYTCPTTIYALVLQYASFAKLINMEMIMNRCDVDSSDVTFYEEEAPCADVCASHLAFTVQLTICLVTRDEQGLVQLIHDAEHDDEQFEFQPADLPRMALTRLAMNDSFNETQLCLLCLSGR
jgi:hypothetical protein